MIPSKRHESSTSPPNSPECREFHLNPKCQRSMSFETTNRTAEQVAMTAKRNESARRLQECVTEARSALNEVSQIKTELDSLSGHQHAADVSLYDAQNKLLVASLKRPRKPLPENAPPRRAWRQNQTPTSCSQTRWLVWRACVLPSTPTRIGPPSAQLTLRPQMPIAVLDLPPLETVRRRLYRSKPSLGCSSRAITSER